MMALLLIALLPSTQAQNASSDSVARFYQEWSEAAASRGPDGYASYFAPDATLLPPDAAPVVGRDNIRDWMRRQTDLPYRAVPEAVTQDEIRIVGEVAVVRTTLRGRRVSKTGEASPFETKYLDVLRRTIEGRWEFVSRMWNSNVPSR
jgi:uncharacterized protein (TIGR02246 family)